MKLLIPTLTFFFHILELVAAIVVFPLTAVCMLGLMFFTLHVAWRMRATQTQGVRTLATAGFGRTA